VEAAFGLEEGSVFITEDAEYEQLQTQNFFTEFAGFPFYLSRLLADVEASTPRLDGILGLLTIGKPMLEIGETAWFERFVLGCFYLPKEQETAEFFDANGLEACNQVAGSSGRWQIVGFLDEESFLVFFNTGLDVAEAQFITELALFRKGDRALEGNEVFTV
jgi:hypothetical protein